MRKLLIILILLLPAQSYANAGEENFLYCAKKIIEFAKDNAMRKDQCNNNQNCLSVEETKALDNVFDVIQNCVTASRTGKYPTPKSKPLPKPIEVVEEIEV